MHFEILIEDLSGKKALDTLMPKIINDQDTFNVVDYRGIGHIPKNLKSPTDVSKRVLLNQLSETAQRFRKNFCQLHCPLSSSGNCHLRLR